ncbi:MAG: PD-(D/E)XK motif protein [Lachnospiraceae bacterium]|nr:PD-(D/E)XK motif protein [Lachnospiraceae bacterium]
MIFNDLKEKWDNIPAVGNGFLKLGLNHPLDLQIGYSINAYKSFVVMNTGVIKNIPSSFAVKVANIQLKNSSWILEFQLVHVKFEEEFLRLCWDMIEYSFAEKQPLNALIHRYMTWQKLLQYENKSVMSFQRQKGLLGELLYLLEIMNSRGIEDTIDSWTGPDGGDQDFVFSIDWTEVKSISLASKTVHISSLQQLKQENDGYLVIYVLESTTAGENRVNLVSIVNKIRDKLLDNARYLDRFELKLYKYGYRKSHEKEYYNNQFRLIEEREYLVNKSFPKLTGDDVSVEVVSCEYDLSLAAIEKYRRR